MKYRLIEWNSQIYIVLGIGYNKVYDPPEVFCVVPLDKDFIRSTIMTLDLIEIPFYEAVEITDKTKIRTIWILYGW